MTALSIQAPFPTIPDIDGQPLEDGYIWIGVANLAPITNPITVYWDAALTLPAAQPVRTLGGYPMNSGTPGRLYAATDYSILVQNKTGSTVYSSADNNGPLFGGTISSVDVTFLQAGTGAVERTAQSKMRDVVSVKDFGAVGNGVADDRPACQNAINAVIAAGGGTVYFPEGTYLLTSATGADGTGNGLLVPYQSGNGTANRVRLVGDGRSSILKANSASMYVVRFSDSHGGISDLTIDGGGLANVIGLGVVPESTTQTTTVVNQQFNIFENLYIKSCANGIVMRCGPDVAGADSGCWYNRFYSCHIYESTRGLWMRDGPNASCSGVNRNQFYSCRFGEIMNTGVQIDAGDTNSFFGCSFEGIASGASPNATPTAILVAASAPFAGPNNYNRFFGVNVEGCTRDLQNGIITSEFYGCLLDGAKLLLTAIPNVLLGGNQRQLNLNLKVVGQITAEESSDASIISTRTGATSMKMEGGGGIGYIKTTTNHPLALGANNNDRMYVYPAGSVVISDGAINTTEQNKFLYVTACPGTPTGIPTSYAGRVPIVVDETNNKLYFYSGGAWRDAGP